MRVELRLDEYGNPYQYDLDGERRLDLLHGSGIVDTIIKASKKIAEKATSKIGKDTAKKLVKDAGKKVSTKVANKLVEKAGDVVNNKIDSITTKKENKGEQIAQLLKSNNNAPVNNNPMESELISILSM